MDYTSSWSTALPVEQMSEHLQTAAGMRPWTACHAIANIEVDFAGPSKAKVRALVYYTVTLRGLSVAVRPFFTAFSVYHHDVVKGDDGAWRSAGLYETSLYDTLLLTAAMGAVLMYVAACRCVA